MGTPAQELGAWAKEVRTLGRLPRQLRADTAGRVMDLLGNCLAALRGGPPAAAVTATGGEWGGAEQATAIGATTRLPVPSAALVNETLARSQDFDDMHLPSGLHPSAAVLPAALAVAEHEDADGPALLNAAAVGIEVACRLAVAAFDEANPEPTLADRGRYAAVLCGTVGAAVAAGMLRRLSGTQLASAIGIACGMGSGGIEADYPGMPGRVHHDLPAPAGVVAADLARHGLTDRSTVLDGQFGLLRALCGGRFDLAAVTDGIGERWASDRISVKPYPCHHFTHAGIDAALWLRRSGINTDAIADIRLGVPEPVVGRIEHTAATGYHAVSSGPYTVAAALLGGGGLGVFHYEFSNWAVSDAARRGLADKVRVEADAECTAAFPRRVPAVLTVRMTNGTVVRKRVMDPRGGPENPLSEEELAAKFRWNAQRAVDDDTAAALIDEVSRLDTAGRPAAIATMLRAADFTPLSIY